MTRITRLKLKDKAVVLSGISSNFYLLPNTRLLIRSDIITVVSSLTGERYIFNLDGNFHIKF